MSARIRLGIALGCVAACGCGGGGSARPVDAAQVVVDSGYPIDPDGGIVEDFGTTYFVRTDGGDASQCTGLADAPYPGSGTAQACAWLHPFVAFPPMGTPRLAGGDRLIIGPGEYRMGVGAPGAEACDPLGAWDCVMPRIPSGIDAEHPTRIYGAGWDGACTAAPELWGAERALQIVDLTGASFVRLDCLELTDHAACVEFHSGGIACERDTPPYGDWAETGLRATDSSSVTLRRLDIHGLAHGGVHAGRLADWTVIDVRIAGNGWVGWDGDVDGDDGNTGTMRFVRWSVVWNGCGETWPGGAPTGCWGQSAGGYGDGVGTGETGGDWVIQDSVFSHNTSDGLDLLYHRRGGTIRIERVRAEGNAGNQLKTTGDTTIVNSIVVGNCGFFDGKAFTHDVDNCRAVGNALSIDFTPGAQVTLANDTIYSEGDCLVLAAGDACDGSERLISRNTIYLGGVDFLQPFEQTCLYYSECAGLAFDEEYDVVHGVKDAQCPAGANNVCEDPRLVDPDPEAFDAHLGAGSPALDSGQGVGGVIPADDIDGKARPAGAGVDRGAYEM